MISPESLVDLEEVESGPESLNCLFESEGICGSKMDCIYQSFEEDGFGSWTKLCRFEGMP